MKLIIDNAFLPPVYYFVLMQRAAEIWVEENENYFKGSYRNKIKILAPNGVETLSIPLKKGKNNKLPFNQVDIYYGDDWLPKFWQAIQTSYGNAPFFIYYKSELKEILFQKQEKIYNLNRVLMQWVLRKLNLDIKLNVTDSFQHKYLEKIDLRFIKSSKDWKSILNFKYTPLVYNQVFEDKFGFVEDLSILDLLFCKGPESYWVLEQSELIFQ